MEPLDDIVRRLCQPCAFPAPPGTVTVLQTHISVVFLADDVVYKIKKPVKLPFLDFSTLEQRFHFCEEEVRINRPWAPEVYLGVVPVTTDARDLRFEGTGPIIDWAVKMRRLPESATLRSLLQNGQLNQRDLEHAARRIAVIHREANPLIGKQALAANASFRRFWLENWDFARTLKSDIIHPQVLQRLTARSAEWMHRHDATLVQRATAGKIREVHGDLRLEHVFLFPERTSPNDIVIIDGIEFSPELRQVDVVADIAFLVMELSFLGRDDLACCVADAYFAESNDHSGSEVLPLFAVYRSAVRAKVAAILASEPEIPPADREKAVARSCAHWLWCLSEMEEPDNRPALVLVSGLPGTGKSTLARMLTNVAHFEVLRSDVVRKDLFESAAANGAPDTIYSADGTQRVYDECWTRARDRLMAGGRVIVDATFQSDSNRQRFLQMAIDCGVRPVWLECRTTSAVARHRLESRHGDASDADWSVYQLIRSQWEYTSDFTERFHESVDCSGDAGAALNNALRVLSECKLTAHVREGTI